MQTECEILSRPLVNLHFLPAFGKTQIKEINMSIDRPLTTTIDEKRCIGCGECVKVCPSETISLLNQKAIITGSDSLVCDHCHAACASGAVSVGGIDPSLGSFAHFEARKEWLPHGKFDISSLVNLMQSRRSCRNYQEQAVEKSLLEDLIKMGSSAPSGSNCQLWTFTILPDRHSVLEFGQQIKLFFEGLNRTAAKRWLRVLLKLIGKPELMWYHQNYYESIKEALTEWDQRGKDVLFHGAPAVIVVGSKKEASCPAEDALLATQNILLGAHALGLGTCLVGFAINALNEDHKIRDFINIPQDENPYAVIAIGYPREKYITVTGRKPAVVRYRRK